MVAPALGLMYVYSGVTDCIAYLSHKIQIIKQI